MTTQQRIERIAREKAETFRLWVSEHRRWDKDTDCEFVLQQLIQQALTGFAEEHGSEAMRALKALMPFALEDYYPTCATKGYYEAMERCIKLTGIGTATPAPSTGEKPE